MKSIYNRSKTGAFEGMLKTDFSLFSTGNASEMVEKRSIAPTEASVTPTEASVTPTEASVAPTEASVTLI